MDLKKKSEEDLVNIIKATEHFTLISDCEGEEAYHSIGKLMQIRDMAVSELERRTGIEGHAALSEYVMGKLKEQDRREGYPDL